MILRQISKGMMLAVLIIPTHAMKEWRVETYSRIPSNAVSFSGQGILIHVKSSASPLVYPFKSNLKLAGFKVRGNFLGLPQFPDVLKQGGKGADDYPLRIGFIVPGEKRLTGLKKYFAPDWAKNLYGQLAKEQGLDHVQFFNITQNPLQAGKRRTHPASDVMREEFIDVVRAPGPFEFEYHFKDPLEAASLWISIDGDDTKSEYAVLISYLELTTTS